MPHASSSREGLGLGLDFTHRVLVLVQPAQMMFGSHWNWLQHGAFHGGFRNPPTWLACDCAQMFKKAAPVIVQKAQHAGDVLVMWVWLPGVGRLARWLVGWLSGWHASLVECRLMRLVYLMGIYSGNVTGYGDMPSVNRGRGGKECINLFLRTSRQFHVKHLNNI